jgi:hypothetical protein
MKNKQTAIEFLVKGLPMVYWEDPYYSHLLEQAKEMEKEQIIDAHGNQQKKSGGVSNYTYILTGEKYYNETFKQ